MVQYANTAKILIDFTMSLHYNHYYVISIKRYGVIKIKIVFTIP